MKKLSMIALALIAAISSFAAPDKTPTKADLADYYQAGQLCVCVYFEEQVCNPIVFAGSYNGWAEKPEEMAKFEKVDGFDGWYVVAVTDESEDIQGKPVQLQSDGTFSWDYQTGDADSWTLLSGTVTIEAGYSGEANLKGYSTTEPVIMISHHFKNSPCVEVVKHDYTINLKAPMCGSDPADYTTYFAPAIIGSFNTWSEGVAMDLNEETMVYTYKFNDKEGGEFKFKAVGDTDWSNQIRILAKNAETGEDEWQDNPNITLGANEVIDIDYSAGKYTLCADNTAVDNVEVEAVATKYFDAVSGQFIIVKGGEHYNVLGSKIQ